MVGNLVAEVHALLASNQPQTARADWTLGVCQKGTMTTALVVDDSLLIRHTVCRLLEKHGFSVESACDGLEALELLKRIQPSLIVTDLMMPKMGGIELIGILKQNPEDCSIPIIVVAGHKSASHPAGRNRRGLHHLQRYRYRGTTAENPGFTQPTDSEPSSRGSSTRLASPVAGTSGLISDRLQATCVTGTFSVNSVPQW